MAESVTHAPGGPGAPPTWTSSAKAGVGTALTIPCNVWFTLAHGILTEAYYPRLDRAAIRDLGLVVTDHKDFFSEEARDTHPEVQLLAPGVPAYQLTNTCNQGRYRIDKSVLADPSRPVVLQQVRFVPLQGSREDYALFVLLHPHLGDHGEGNTAWLGDYKGVPMLFARRGDCALALACSAGWRRRSAGFVSTSDGWQDLSRHKQMTWTYDRAENGNVALTGEVDLRSGDGFLLALAFGRDQAEAGRHARAALLDDHEAVQNAYVRGWTDWHATLLSLRESGKGARDLYPTSMMVLRCHESDNFPGAIIASLSIPWGEAHGDKDAAGYHVVWPRDLAESAGALLAAGAHGDASRVLFNLQVTQEADGHWAQNMWLDGSPNWTSQQMDETGLAILFVNLMHGGQGRRARDTAPLWPMVRRAAAYLVRNGPVTREDRWEEDAGFSPYTLAVEIAALLAAADLAEANGEAHHAGYLRETADTWNDNIERWTYVRDTELARRAGVEGYYVRIGPPDEPQHGGHAAGEVPVQNRPEGKDHMPAARMVSPDALALVRFGLRAADDPRMVNTVRVLDALLKVETPGGPAWHRYNEDGYGEHADGAPFDGTGIGRAWPLLTGERAHYELAAGRPDEARRLLRTMASFANEAGLLPEQVWDTADIPARGLYLGKPSGSAMPLVWAHAEYVKLRRSLHDGRVFDMPPQPVGRYVRKHTVSPHHPWRFNLKSRSLPAGKTLRVEVLAPAVVRWSADGWQTTHDTPTRDTGWGVHLVDLPTTALAEGTTIVFTFRWTQDDRWEGKNFEVRVIRAVPSPAPNGAAKKEKKAHTSKVHR